MINHPKYSRGNLYLSGGMQYTPDQGAKWRADLSPRLMAMKYYPIDIARMDREYAKKYGELYFMEDTANHLQYKSNIRKHFITTDIELVLKDSDALIVYYDESVRRGAGTISECQIAYSNDIPVFVVSAFPNWEKEVPGWLQALSTSIFQSFMGLEYYLDSLPYGILKRDQYGNRGTNNKYLCSLCGDIFEKTKNHFVSKITPLYCSPCVDLITKTHEHHVDRYQFIVNFLTEESRREMMEAITEY
jgi:hypothetical protein